MIPDNARSPRITAAAGTELAGASSTGTVKAGYKPTLSSRLTVFYTDELRLHTRGVAASGLPPLRNIPHCCLP